MRRAPRARVQIASATTPATVSAAIVFHEALEEDVALRAPQTFALTPGPGEDGAEDDDADDVAYDEALANDDDDNNDDHDDDGIDSGFVQLTNHRGLPVTMANTVRARTTCLARRARARAHARARTHARMHASLRRQPQMCSCPSTLFPHPCCLQRVLKASGGRSNKKGAPEWTKVATFTYPPTARATPARACVDSTVE